MYKITLEHRQFAIFTHKFNDGKFGTQRLGQAFYDYFKLDKLSNQAALKNLYAKDGKQAANLIMELFEFN
jgi:hypothetical protein